MKKIGHPSYLSNDKGSLIVAAADIEGGHGLPLDSTYILDQFHIFIKVFRFLCSGLVIITF